MKISLFTLALLVILPAGAFADQPEKADQSSQKLSEAEQEFVDMLTGSTLVGKFSMELQPNAIPKEEQYSIISLRKLKGDQWIIESSMRVDKNELPIPVPVHVLWAGDTPMLQLTDLTIPLVGEDFTVRILFYRDRYAGTWQHGEIGGHLWGRIEHPANDASKN